MPSPDCIEKIVSRHELIEISRKFLESVAESIQAKFKSPPKRLQKSMWMVSERPGNKRSREFKREIFDSERVLDIFLSQIRDKDSSEKAQLREALKKIDKPYGKTLLDSQLVVKWLKLPNPLSFEEPSISNLLDEFVDVVLDRKMFTKSLTVIDGLNVTSLPIDFEDGITIRQITPDELWKFGDLTKLKLLLPMHSDCIPSETWKILEIKLRHDVPKGPKAYSTSEVRAICDTVLTSLRLVSSGSLKIIDMGTGANYV